jgi:ABC-2 type transport system permease protein
MMIAPVIRKEILLLKRDPRVLVRLLALPIAFIALFGMAFNASKDKAKERHRLIAFVDAQAAHGADISKALGATFEVHPAKDATEVARAVSAGDFDVGIVLAADFAPDQKRPARVYFDPDAPAQQTGPLRGVLEGALRAGLAGGILQEPMPVITEVDPDADPKTHAEKPSAFQLTVPGNAVLFGFFIALTCALGFAEERRSGTWRRLLAAPVPAWQLLVAKLVPYVVLGIVQVGTLFAIGVFAFGMKVYGSVPALAVLTIGVSCCATALGLALSAFSTTEKQISSLGSVVILIMGLIGGCMFPRALMPETLKHLGLFVPHGWALDGYYTLLVHSGAGFADVARPILAVFGFAALFAFIGVRRFRFDR